MLDATGDASADGSTSTPDASVPATAIAIALPAYVPTGATVAWHASLVGPALATFDYAVAVSPPTAATVMPSAGSGALGSDGMLELDAMLTAGSGAGSATVSVDVTGQTAGSASADVPVVRLVDLGYAGGGAASDWPISGGRLVAMPLHVPSGTRVVGFGLQARSSVDVQLALYSGGGNVPGQLLVASPIIHPQVGTVLSYFAQPQTLTSDAGFIAVVTQASTNLVADTTTADYVTQYAVNATFGAALPSSFGTATSFSQGPYAIFAIAIAP